MPVVVLMRHADAESFKPVHGSPDRRPLSTLGKVQADTIAWRIACSFGHANGGDVLPDSKRSKSGRTGVRAATGRLEKVREGGIENAIEENGAVDDSGPGTQASGDDDLDPNFDPFAEAADLEKLDHDAEPEQDSEPDGIASALPTVIRCSPALRCLQSAEPLEELLGCQVEPWEALREDKDFDLMRDLLPELEAAPRAVIVTHQPQVEATLNKLGLSHLGPVQVGSAYRILLSGDGRLIGARKV